MKSGMLAALALGLVFAVGCQAKAGARTPGEVWGFCMNSAAEDGSCVQKNDICDSYKELLQEEYPNAKVCRKACYGVRERFLHQQGAFGCTQVFNSAEAYCTSNCNARYDGQ
jgi:hypothetical protein